MLNLEQQIFKQIEKSKNILIVFSKNQDGDAVAAALGLLAFLKKEDYQVSLAGQTVKENSTFSFLPNYNQIEGFLSNLRRFVVSVDISQAKVSQIKYAVENDRLDFIISPSEGWFKPEDVSSRVGEFKYDLIITIGVNELESLGSLYDQNVEFFYKTTIINIDNQPDNEDFGQINFIDLNAVAVSEIIFYLLKNYRSELISEDIATCLLTGIIQKTKNFKSSNLTPRTLLASSELIAYQARREEIISRLYRSRDIRTLRLWGKFLSHLHSENNESLIWSKLTAKHLKEAEASLENLDDVIDELIVNVPRANLVLVFYEKSLSETKLILYSLKNVNALEILSKYSPQGNSRLASAIIKQDVETASATIIPDLKNKLEKLGA
jgi:phosphoesterase RecJ-like protein